MMSLTLPSKSELRRLSRAEKIELLGLIDESERRRRENKLASYAPYSKQREFHENGATARERLLMASNQTGKTFSGAMEMAYHLTGRYPDWWRGRRFEKPIRAWIGSQTLKQMRESTQVTVCGDPTQIELLGTGAIPKDAIERYTKMRGVADCYDSLVVRHVSGGSSSVSFKTYEEGRKAWQGASQDVVWYDEEPPIDVYIEGLTRTNATRGIVYLTFTPLLGMSEVVHSFLEAE